MTAAGSLDVTRFLQAIQAGVAVSGKKRIMA